jgi:DNA polymerase-3 subunit alpha
MAAILSRNLSDIKSITKYMDECKRMGLQVLGPDINESYLKFTVNPKGQIRFGLAAIKGVGEAAVHNIVEERNKKGLFTDIFDFVERISLRSITKRTIEALALAGAFDSFKKIKRHQYFVSSGNENSFIETLIKYGTKIQDEKNAPQKSLFGLVSDLVITRPEIPQAEEWSDYDRLNKEKELIGIYLSAHPLDNFSLEIKSFCNKRLEELNDLEHLAGKKITVAGIVKSTKSATTRNGNPYGSITLEDYTGSHSFILYGNEYLNQSKYFVKGYSLLVRGKVQYRPSFGKEENIPKVPEFKVENIEMLTELRNKIKSLELKIPLSIIDDEMVQKFKEFAESNKGNVLMKLFIYDELDKIETNGIMFSRKYKIAVNDALLKYFEKYPDIDIRLLSN